jgi:GNAT superfamily N-acetyltransferase
MGQATSWQVRPLSEADIPRVLEISAGIWEGYDYVPQVIERWLHEEDGEVLGAFQEGTLVSFGHTLRLFPDLAWMEGLRSDPTRQGQGAGRALAEGALERARCQGYKEAAFSTYIENLASIHINESLGFVRTAVFVFAEVGEDGPLPGLVWPEAVVPSDEEIEAFLAGSQAFTSSAGWLAEGWRFFPFARDHVRALSHHPWRLGIRSGGRLSALLLASRGHEDISIDFLEGDAEVMNRLVLDLVTRLPAGARLEASLPSGGDLAASLQAVRGAGLVTNHGDQPDLFVYCKDLSQEP